MSQVGVTVGGVDRSDVAQSLEWSTVDPGGFELASFEIPNDTPGIAGGGQVVISVGIERVFMGRVEEPGDNFDARRAPGQIAAVGAGAAAKDNQASAIFIDRALSRWSGPSRGRIVALGSAWNTTGGDAIPDATTNAPALRAKIEDAWTTVQPAVELWYDAGDANNVGRLRYAWTQAGSTNGPGDPNWFWRGSLHSDDTAAAAFDDTGDQSAAGSGTTDLAATTARRFARIQFLYPAAPAGAAGAAYELHATAVRVIGDQGLTIRGATAAEEGFYPSDIAAWALGQVPGLVRGVVVDSTDLILPHCVYYTRVDHEKFAMDMADLMGWHYGVWEPLSMLSDTPRWDFRPRPSEATVIVNRSDCQSLRLAQRLSDFHDRAVVTYQDAAGTTASVTVTRANPRLPSTLSRTLPLSLGQSTAAIAAAYGADALALEEQQTRAAGSVQLPPMVRTASGGLKPSYLLKAGLDRLKITGLPNAGPWTETDSRRFDTFRIRRLSHKVQAGGAIVTTAELDAGANLIETLQARLAVAAALAG